MAYVLHATGKSVTVEAAEKFQAETGNKICTGYNMGGWFCFNMPKAADTAKDKKLAAKYFKDALIETRKERSARIALVPLTKPEPLLAAESHNEIAKSIKEKNPMLNVNQLCKLVGDANHDYCDAHNLKHNALDYYAVQGALVRLG